MREPKSIVAGEKRRLREQPGGYSPEDLALACMGAFGRDLLANLHGYTEKLLADFKRRAAYECKMRQRDYSIKRDPKAKAALRTAQLAIEALPLIFK